MISMFYILSIIVAVTMFGSLFLVNKSNLSIAKSLSRTIIYAFITVGCYVALVSAKREYTANVIFAIFSASVDWLMIQFFLFIRDYTYERKATEEEKRKSPYVVIPLVIMSVADTVSLMLNPIHGHVYSCERATVLGDASVFVGANFTIFYYIHLLVSYVMVIWAAGMIFRAYMKCGPLYRIKYATVLGAFSLLIIGDGICILTHSAINYAILFYGLVTAIITYIAISFQPKQLLNAVQEMVMDNSNSAIVCFDSESRFVYSNDKIWDLFGYSNRGQLYLEEWLEREKAQTEYFDQEIKVMREVTVDQQKRYIEIECKKIYDNKEHFVGTYISLKDRTEVQMRHFDEIETVNRANRQKTQFLSRVSHDIRTPVNSILGMNEMIMRESKDPDIREYANNIKDAVAILQELISEVLDFSKIESGKMELFEREYSTNELISGIFNIISIQASSHKLNFTYSIPENFPSKLKGDDVKLSQIIINLLNNAVKYTPSGGIRIEITVKERTHNRIKSLISVKDTGKGIKKEDMPKLFDAFERIEDTKNHSIEGSGLGLNIVSNFLSLMNSKLEVESEFGKGSNFFFEIWQEIIDDSPMKLDTESKKKEETAEEIFVAPDARVLVVDDNAMNRKVFKGLLKRNKIKIAEADSGMKCLELVAAEKYDIIFMDHMMPEMDGMETFEKMKAMDNNLNKGVPVVMLTANVVKGAEEEYREAGFDGFLTKPVDPDKLEAMIKGYLLEK